MVPEIQPRGVHLIAGPCGEAVSSGWSGWDQVWALASYKQRILKPNAATLNLNCASAIDSLTESFSFLKIFNALLQISFSCFRKTQQCINCLKLFYRAEVRQRQQDSSCERTISPFNHLAICTTFLTKEKQSRRLTRDLPWTAGCT